MDDEISQYSSLEEIVYSYEKQYKHSENLLKLLQRTETAWLRSKDTLTYSFEKFSVYSQQISEYINISDYQTAVQIFQKV